MGNTTAGLNDSAAAVDATGNWWGSINGPTTAALNTYAYDGITTGNAVIGNATVAPWLTDGTNYASPGAPGFVPGTLDPTYPSVPGAPTTAGNLSSDGTIVTNVTTPTFNGTADPGTTVALMEGTTVLGQTTAANVSGDWSIMVPNVNALSTGNHTFVARSTKQTGLAKTSVTTTVLIATTPTFSDLSSPSILYGTATTTLSGDISASVYPQALSPSRWTLAKGRPDWPPPAPSHSFSIPARSTFRMGLTASPMPPKPSGLNPLSAINGTGTLTVNKAAITLHDRQRQPDLRQPGQPGGRPGGHDHHRRQRREPGDQLQQHRRHATAHVGTYAITGRGVQRHGPGERLQRDPDQRHADGQPVRLQLHDRQRQPDLRHGGEPGGGPAGHDQHRRQRPEPGDRLQQHGRHGTAHVGTYAITGVLSNGTGAGERLHGDPDQRHADGQPVRLQLHDRQRQPDLRQRGQPGRRPAATINTGVNGENLDITYSSTGDTATANVGTLRHHRRGVQRHGPGERLHRDPDQRHADGQPVRLQLHDRQRQPDLRHGRPTWRRTCGTTINTGVNGENLDIAYSSTGDTATANVGSYAITGVVSNGTGLAERLHGDPDQRHADGQPVRLQLHDRQRQPDLRHAGQPGHDLGHDQHRRQRREPGHHLHQHGRHGHGARRQLRHHGRGVQRHRPGERLHGDADQRHADGQPVRLQLHDRQRQPDLRHAGQPRHRPAAPRSPPASTARTWPSPTAARATRPRRTSAATPSPAWCPTAPAWRATTPSP